MKHISVCKSKYYLPTNKIAITALFLVILSQESFMAGNSDFHYLKLRLSCQQTSSFNYSYFGYLLKIGIL